MGTASAEALSWGGPGVREEMRGVKRGCCGVTEADSCQKNRDVASGQPGHKFGFCSKVAGAFPSDLHVCFLLSKAVGSRTTVREPIRPPKVLTPCCWASKPRPHHHSLHLLAPGTALGSGGAAVSTPDMGTALVVWTFQQEREEAT